MTDYGSKYSFHGLDLVFYLQDESRYKLTPQDKATAESFQNLIDIFVRTGSTQTLNNQFSVGAPACASVFAAMYVDVSVPGLIQTRASARHLPHVSTPSLPLALPPPACRF